MLPTVSKHAARKRAQRAIPTVECQWCGKSGVRLDRHHPDILNEPLFVEVLCQQCHVKADMRDGTRHVKQPNVCVVCGVEFNCPKHTTRTCGPECLSRLGRINANKRWNQLDTA